MINALKHEGIYQDLKKKKKKKEEGKKGRKKEWSDLMGEQSSALYTGCYIDQTANSLSKKNYIERKKLKIPEIGAKLLLFPITIHFSQDQTYTLY